MTGYVQLADAAALGASPSVTQAHLDQASLSVDGFCKRPEGFLYSVDSAGNPVQMTRKQPAQQFKLTAAVSAGTAVTIQVSGPTGQILPGDPLVLGYGASSPELVSVISVTGQSILLASVAGNHASGDVVASGLLITEQRPVQPARNIARVSRLPVAMLATGAGRYGYSRRGVSNMLPQPVNLLASVSAFGGPPAWEVFDPSRASIDTTTGAVWIGAGLLMAYYTEVRLHYLSGWTADAIPYPIRQAVVRIANNIAQIGYGIPLQSESVDNTRWQRQTGGRLADGGIVDAESAELLKPFKVLVLS